jgi:hypothetical protein
MRFDHRNARQTGYSIFDAFRVIHRADVAVKEDDGAFRHDVDSGKVEGMHKGPQCRSNTISKIRPFGSVANLSDCSDGENTGGRSDDDGP